VINCPGIVQEDANDFLDWQSTVFKAGVWSGSGVTCIAVP